MNKKKRPTRPLIPQESAFDKEQKRIAAGRSFIRARVALELTDAALLSIHFGMPESAFTEQVKVSYESAKSLLSTDAGKLDVFKLAL